LIARIAIVAASLALVGCGYEPENSPDPRHTPTPAPIPTTGARDLMLTNEYAVSIFTVKIVEHPSERASTLFSDLRLDYKTAAVATGAIGADSTSVTITAHATSLGQGYTIGPKEMQLNHSGTLGMVYLYDLATASFSMAFGFYD
jgi:hypothetical protein